MTMCELKRKTRSCKFFNKVESFKINPRVTNVNIMDIEDIVTLGKGCGFCPYYMSKELKEQSDIIFMPYNYLLDPSLRKSLSKYSNVILYASNFNVNYFYLDISLLNSVVILDEAHNVERICEESASLQIKSSDIALAIEEVTTTMKMMSEENLGFDDSPKDFDTEDLCILKEVFLNLEKEIDKIDLKGKSAGLTLDGTYIFNLLESAGVCLINIIFCIANLDL